MNMLMSDFYIVRNWPLAQCKTLTALTSSGRSSSTSFLATFSKVAMAMSLISSWRWFSRSRHWANVFIDQRNQPIWLWALTQKIGSVHQWCWCIMRITVDYSMKRIYALNCFNEAANHVCDVSLEVFNNLLQQKWQITNNIKCKIS